MNTLFTDGDVPLISDLEAPTCIRLMIDGNTAVNTNEVVDPYDMPDKIIT